MSFLGSDFTTVRPDTLTFECTFTHFVIKAFYILFETFRLLVPNIYFFLILKFWAKK